MSKFQGYFKIVQPKGGVTTMADNQSVGDSGTYSNSTWYQRLVQGSASRITRYREYDLMDNDVEIARSLDTIAEEICGSDPNSDLPLNLVIQADKEQNIPSSTVMTLRAALRYWCDMHDWRVRLFKIARVTIKFGDCFFIRNKETTKWEYIHPKHVVAAIVDDRDMTRVLGWQIKRETKAPNSPYNQPVGNFGGYSNEMVDTFPVDEVVWFTLNDDVSDTAPFGDSVLRAVFRAQKQKELIEDAIIIYRIQRSPERRVFYMDVGKMPPHRIKGYLEGIKNEIKQRKVPTTAGGVDQIDSVYNPQSMCLALDTKIPLLDGRTLSLQDMIIEHNDGKQNWVYSVNPANGDIAPGIVSWAGVTQYNAETIKLTLDNGEVIICTPEHKFPVQGKGFIEAKDLTPTDSLFPFNNRQEHNSESRIIETIEKDNNQDVGTLTIDQDEKYHNYHTFALSSGIYTRNSEDYFFSTRDGGKGSRVEVLPGGNNLGVLSDLEYLQAKVFRGLRIPLSFMQGDGNAIFNDGKAGIAYIQELRFAMYIKRLQNYISMVLDDEFKRYLKNCGVQVDPTIFFIKLPEPENFGIYRQQQLNNDLLGTFSQADGITTLSKRFTMEKYLQLSHEDILVNQRLKAEELGLNPDNLTVEDMKQIYNPAPDDGGMSGGLGGGSGMSAGMLGGGMGFDDGLGMEGEGGDISQTSGAGETPPELPASPQGKP